MLQSMTGYGKSTVSTSIGEFNIEIKSLNSKGYDINIHSSNIIKHLDIALRKSIIQKLKRGKIDIYLSLDKVTTEQRCIINKELVEDYISQLKSICKPISKAKLLSIAIKLPDTILHHHKEISENQNIIDDTVSEAVSIAVEDIISFRKREGEALYKDINTSIKNIQKSLDTLKKENPKRKQYIKDRLHSAFEDVKIKYDEGRMEQELIYYLEKLDINEELVRLEEHLDYFNKTTCDTINIAKGKRLSFIAQEIGREINTIGSKSNDVFFQQTIILMKENLEQVKEQILNVL